MPMECFLGMNPMDAMIAIMDKHEWHLVLFDKCSPDKELCYCDQCKSYILIFGKDDYCKKSIAKRDDFLIGMNYYSTFHGGIPPMSLATFYKNLQREIIHLKIADQKTALIVYRLAEQFYRSISLRPKMDHPHSLNPMHPAWSARWDFEDGKIDAIQLGVIVEEANLKIEASKKKLVKQELSSEGKAAIKTKKFDATRLETTPLTVSLSDAKRLEKARNEKQLSQKAAANLLNISLQDYKEFEKVGGRMPNKMQKKALHTKIGVHFE